MCPVTPPAAVLCPAGRQGRSCHSQALAHIPWMIKPLYGFFTDTFPIYGLRRRPYIVICGLAGGDHVPHRLRSVDGQCCPDLDHAL